MAVSATRRARDSPPSPKRERSVAVSDTRRTRYIPPCPKRERSVAVSATRSAYNLPPSLKQERSVAVSATRRARDPPLLHNPSPVLCVVSRFFSFNLLTLSNVIVYLTVV
ncbi:MAG: hypothetical protein LBK25_06505 [Treponema sp.]|nr:hypothetical protein [Treponema sp.]